MLPDSHCRKHLNGRFDGPRKKNPAAMNRPKHMRQRCRAMRFAPKTPPRTSMRKSPAAASSITEPMKKLIPTGTPSCELAPLRTTFRPFIQVRIPSAKGIRSTIQSKRLVSPSLRLAHWPVRRITSVPNESVTRWKLCSPNSSNRLSCARYDCDDYGKSLSSSTWQLQRKI